MNARSIYWMSGLVLGLLLLTAPHGWAQAGASPKGPIITHAFTVTKGVYGDAWKIYIEAEDPDGEMLRIATVVDQVGYGHYPTSWLYLKAENRKHFKGYLQWNTADSMIQQEWTQLTLTVSVFDRSGRESNEVVLPITFETGVKRVASYPLPSPFDQGNLVMLGHIDTSLFNPSRMGDGHRGGRMD